MYIYDSLGKSNGLQWDSTSCEEITLSKFIKLQSGVTVSTVFITISGTKSTNLSTAYASTLLKFKQMSISLIP